jgi:hypothetical protein
MNEPFTKVMKTKIENTSFQLRINKHVNNLNPQLQSLILLLPRSRSRINIKILMPRPQS